MERSILKLTLLFCLAGLAACSTGNPTGREVRSETKEMRKAAVILAAKEGNYYFNLRANNVFDYYGTAVGMIKAELYAGTYERRGDSLYLAFHNNYQPGDLTNKGFIDRSANQVVLLSKDPGQHRRLGILLGK
jgi:hypothetical protein